MSRPLLGLILINHDSFGKVQENLCSQQPQEKQAQLSKVRRITFSIMVRTEPGAACSISNIFEVFDLKIYFIITLKIPKSLVRFILERFINSLFSVLRI